ncbi:MAG: hypothetical protein R3B47_21560 [Bacteroidia bacterium]
MRRPVHHLTYYLLLLAQKALFTDQFAGKCFEMEEDDGNENFSVVNTGTIPDGLYLIQHADGKTSWPVAQTVEGEIEYKNG